MTVESLLMLRVPNYLLPFDTQAQIEELVQEYEKYDATLRWPDESALKAGKLILAGHLSSENLQQIYWWKLESFFDRFEWVRGFPAPNEWRKVEAALQAVVNTTDYTLLDTLKILDDLSGVGLPVASAVLTAVHPDRFTVIDRQAYKALRVPFRNPSHSEYLYYLKFCRGKAEHYRVSLRDFDRALWQSGVQIRPI
jgi:hypothetical protein